MTDEQSPDNESAQNSETAPNWRRELEARAKRADDLEAELASLKRREVFRNAGLDPADGMTSYFMRGYDGELTVDAIRGEAENVGLYARDTSPDPAVSAETGAERRIAQAADDAPPVGEPDLVDLIRQTSNAEELRELIEANGGTFSAAE